MRVLELLAFAPLSAPQLAAALRAQPRTVRRVLDRLVEDGYVVFRDPQRRVYEPTMRLVALAGQVVENSPLARSARPYVALLQQRCEAPAHLVVPSYDSVMCLVHAAPGAEETRPRLRELVPAHCSAGGKVLLAWRDRWRESVLNQPLARYTDHTTTDPVALRRVLEHARMSGHATEDGEYQADIRAIAAPVLLGEDAIAAVSVSGRRLQVDEMVGPVRQAANELADDLRRGWR